MTEYEEKYWCKNQLVAGIDETGRGPMAGPLVVCAVVLPYNYKNIRINDSKALSEKMRDELYTEILRDALEIKVEIVNERMIDRFNIYQATRMAMETVGKKVHSSALLVDAMVLNSDKESISIVKGDQKSISIAAASIVAKVIRDEIMVNYDKVYPQYGFKDHKGYPTKRHKEALLEHGVLNIHRRSYRPVMEALQPRFDLDI